MGNNYGIKIVWPDWYKDDERYDKVNFPRSYREKHFQAGDKMLVYLTKEQYDLLEQRLRELN